MYVSIIYVMLKMYVWTIYVWVLEQNKRKRNMCKNVKVVKGIQKVVIIVISFFLNQRKN